MNEDTPWLRREVTTASVIIIMMSAEAAVEEIRVTDEQLQASWGKTVYRITVTAKGQKGEIYFEIKR